MSLELWIGRLARSNDDYLFQEGKAHARKEKDRLGTCVLQKVMQPVGHSIRTRTEFVATRIVG